MLQQALTSNDVSIFDRTRWLASEMLVLNQRFVAATCALETARVDCSLAGMRSAYLDLEKIAEQATALTGSLLVAITNEDQRRGKA